MSHDGATRLLVFTLGGERFGVPLAEVEEVIGSPAVQASADFPPPALGIAEVRGEPVIVYDSRPLLNVGGSVDDAVILLTYRGRRVGLAVGNLQDTINAEAGEIRPVPAAELSDKVLTGLIRRGFELIAVIDVDQLLEAATHG